MDRKDPPPAVDGLRTPDDLSAAVREHGRVVLVVNAGSRRTARVRPRLARMLAEAGVRLMRDVTVVAPGALPDALGDALALRPDLLVVGGGDGTVTTAAAMLAHRDVALGVLPLGTTNNVARSLGLPLTVRGAVRALAAARVAEVDLGRLHLTDGDPDGDVLFANLVSLGVSVEVARRAPRRLKRWLGRAAYAATALAVLPGHQPITVTLTGLGSSRRFLTHQLNLANGRFHAGRPLAREAAIDDHRLHVYRLGGASRASLVLATARHVLAGARRSEDDDAFLVTAAVSVDTDPPLALDVDGEVRGHTPFAVSVAESALRVVVAAR
jgi:YegS/Rv2252/BmrU family lipid kinase